MTDLATEREGHLTTEKRLERTKLDFWCHWSSQLFDLRALSSTDVLILLLNQPNLIIHAAALNKPELPVGHLLNPTKTNLLSPTIRCSP